MTTTTIDLVRHGEVQTPGLFCAAPQEPLSETGWAQLNALVSSDNTFQKNVSWAQIVSWPQRRCREFAEQLAARYSIALSIEPDWREMNFGDWTGMPHNEIWGHEPEKLSGLWSQPLSFQAPGENGEHMMDFSARVKAAWTGLLKRYTGQNVLLLTHAGAIRCVLANTLELDYQSAQKLNIAHGRVNRVRCYEDGETSLLNLACPAQYLTE